MSSATSLSLSLSGFGAVVAAFRFSFSASDHHFLLTPGCLCHCLLRYRPTLLYSSLFFSRPLQVLLLRARVFGSALILVCATSSWPFVFAAWGVPCGGALFIAEEIAAQDELRGGRGLGQAQAQPPASWISL